MPRHNCEAPPAFSSRSCACSNNSRAVLRSSSARRCCASARANNSSAPARRSSVRARLVATSCSESAPTRSSIRRIVTAVILAGRSNLWKNRRSACTLHSPDRGKPLSPRLNFTLFAGEISVDLWKVVVEEQRIDPVALAISPRSPDGRLWHRLLGRLCRLPAPTVLLKHLGLPALKCLA